MTERDVQSFIRSANRVVCRLEVERDSLVAKVERLREVLRKIEKWHGEFPPTGRFWDKDGNEPMSYAAAFGSNGERDYMREIARTALQEESS